MVLRELEIMGSRALYRENLQDIVEVVEGKENRAAVCKVHPISKANEVLTQLRQREIIGSVVLKP